MKITIEESNMKKNEKSPLECGPSEPCYFCVLQYDL